MWYEFEYLRWWCYLVCCTRRMRQRERSHQLWPTKHCRVVRKYWAQTGHWLVRSFFHPAPRDLLQCSACGVAVWAESGSAQRVSLFATVCELSVLCLTETSLSQTISLFTSYQRVLGLLWGQHRFRTLLRSRESSVRTGSLIIFSGIYTQTPMT